MHPRDAPFCLWTRLTRTARPDLQVPAPGDTGRDARDERAVSAGERQLVLVPAQHRPHLSADARAGERRASTRRRRLALAAPSRAVRANPFAPIRFLQLLEIL